MKEKKSGFIWGAIFITAGILYILNEFTNINIDLFDFWALIIILPAISSIIKKGIRPGNMFWLLIGSAFLLSSLNIIPDKIIDRLFVPICLIIIGIIIIFKDKLAKPAATKWAEERFNDGATSGYSAIFSSNKVIYPHSTFTGAESNSIFGSVVLNLTDAIITEDTIINCYCVFGGTDILVPDGVNVRVSGFPIFGGVSNKRKNFDNPNAPTLFINTTTMFGGVNIR